MPELRATTTTGTSTVLPEAVVQAFKTGLRGPLHCPGDYDYEATRTVYHAMIDPAAGAESPAASVLVISSRAAVRSRAESVSFCTRWRARRRRKCHLRPAGW